jgi:hypothetical protein
MALQTFTAGQVLTAAQVNALQANDYNQTVSTKTDSYTLVAADKGTRVVMNKATATTITVNTDLFNAGDTLFIQNIGAGVCTITAGTATVSSTGSLALAANAGGTLYFTSAGVSVFFASAAASASGLTLVKTQTIGSAVTSVAVTGAFSATYDAYKITLSGGVASIATDIQMTLTGGSNSYSYNLISTSFSSSVVSGTPVSAGTNWGYVGAGTVNRLDMNCDITDPFSAKFTTMNSRVITNAFAGVSNGVHGQAASFTGFSLLSSAGTFTGGEIRVYGYQNS